MTYNVQLLSGQNNVQAGQGYTCNSNILFCQDGSSVVKGSSVVYIVMQWTL